MIRTFIGGVAHGQQIDVGPYDYWTVAVDQSQSLDEADLSTRCVAVHRYRMEPFSINGHRDYLMVYDKIEAGNVFGYLVGTSVIQRSLLDRLKSLLDYDDPELLVQAVRQLAR